MKNFPIPAGFIPSSADLRKFDSPGQQQLVASCTGDAVASAYENLLRQKGPEYEIELSRTWVWYYGRAALGLANKSVGCTVNAVVNSLTSTGICPEINWQYTDKNATVLPLNGDLTLGKPYIISADKIYQCDTVESVFAALSANKPVVLTVNEIFAGFPHVVLVVAYDDKGVIVKDCNVDGFGNFYKTLTLDQLSQTYDRWTFELDNPPVVHKWKKYAILRWLAWFFKRFIA